MKNILFPSPKKMEEKGKFTISSIEGITILTEDPTCQPQVKLIKEYLEKIGQNRVKISERKNAHRVILKLSLDENIKEEGYQIKVKRSPKNQEILLCNLSARDKRGLFYSCYTFLKLIEVKEKKISIPLATIEDWPSNKIRPIIISVGWNQIYEGPSKWNLDEWRNFIDMILEFKYNIFYLCNWESDQVFPFDWYRIRMYKHIREFSVMAPIQFSKWNGEKMVNIKWQHPFLKDSGMLKKIISYAHSKGIKVGFFTTPHFVCVHKEKDHLDYWRYILKFLIKEYHFDAFMFEDEETVEAYNHLKSCKICQKKWGDLPLARTRREANMIKAYYEVIKKNNPEAIVSGIPHCCLHYLGVPQEEYSWFKNLNNYEKNLRKYDEIVPKDFLLNWVPAEQTYKELWLKVFGKRIIKGGYNGYWPLFRGDWEISAIGRSEYFWNNEKLEAGFSFWDNLGTIIGKEEAKKSAMILFGSGYRYSYQVGKLKIEPSFKRRLGVAQGYDEPSQVAELEKLFTLHKAEEYIQKVKKIYKEIKEVLEEMEEEFKKVSSNLISSWDVKLGIKSTIGKVKKSVYALEYLIKYYELLCLKEDGKDYHKEQKALEEIGINICNAMVEYIPDWPGTGNRQELRFRGLYQILYEHPVLYNAYLEHSKKLKNLIDKEKL